MRSLAELSRSGKLRVNSSVFNWRLKDACEDNDVRDLDRLFHVRAAATGKARSPAVERHVGGTTSVDVDEEHRRWRAAKSDTRSRSRDKYDGARPFRQRKTSTESLNSIHCSILSQCISWRSGVTWSYLLHDKTKQNKHKQTYQLSPYHNCCSVSSVFCCPILEHSISQYSDGLVSAFVTVTSGLMHSSFNHYILLQCLCVASEVSHNYASAVSTVVLRDITPC